MIESASTFSIMKFAVLNIYIQKLQTNNAIEKTKSLVNVKRRKKDVWRDALIPIVRAPMGIRVSIAMGIKTSKELRLTFIYLMMNEVECNETLVAF